MLDLQRYLWPRANISDRASAIRRKRFARHQGSAKVGGARSSRSEDPWALAGNQLTARALKASFQALPAGAVERGARIFGTQLGQAVAKNTQAFVGNVGSAVGQSVTSDMVSEDYDLLEDTTLGGEGCWCRGTRFASCWSQCGLWRGGCGCSCGTAPWCQTESRGSAQGSSRPRKSHLVPRLSLTNLFPDQALGN